MGKPTKANKDYAELIESLTDLKEWEFREAIRIAKQFRRAQRHLAKVMERQQRESLLPKKSTKNERMNASSIAGVDYAY